MTTSNSANKPGGRIAYKWVVLSNTTLAMLLISVNQTIVLVSLPAIFSGLESDPLGRGQASYLLWMANGYAMATTVLLLTFGRLGDTHGKARIYKLGFLVFGIGSLLCALTPSMGDLGALELIVFRIVQGVGGAMLFAVNLAIVTDAFPASERGFAYSINQLAFVVGNIGGLVLGGLLAAVDWRLIFAVSAPIAFAGTLWSHAKLRDIVPPRPARPDIPGNLVFAGAIILIMLGLSYAVIPYGGHSLGWHNPVVLGAIGGGLLMFVWFVFIESRSSHPMLNLELFKIRAFSAANVANVLFQLSRGGLQFILIIWLQAVWLPLQGVPVADTPLKAGVAMIPLMAAFSVAAPIGGRLADRHGARVLATVGLLCIATGLLLMASLDVDFAYWRLAVYLCFVGIGMGLFAAPNSTQLFGSVPRHHIGTAGGVRQALGNASQLVSTALFFTVLISAMSTTLPGALRAGLADADVAPAVAEQIAGMPAATAVFSAELGVNPMTRFVSESGGDASAVMRTLPPESDRFFAELIAEPFSDAMRIGFIIAAAMALLGAFVSAFRGPRVAFEEVPEARVEEALG